MPSLKSSASRMPASNPVGDALPDRHKRPCAAPRSLSDGTISTHIRGLDYNSPPRSTGFYAFPLHQQAPSPARLALHAVIPRQQIAPISLLLTDPPTLTGPDFGGGSGSSESERLPPVMVRPRYLRASTDPTTALTIPLPARGRSESGEAVPVTVDPAFELAGSTAALLASPRFLTSCSPRVHPDREPKQPSQAVAEPEAPASPEVAFVGFHRRPSDPGTAESRSPEQEDRGRHTWTGTPVRSRTSQACEACRQRKIKVRLTPPRLFAS